MPGVVLFLILGVFCPGSVYLSSDIGICSKINSTIKCCSNFKLNESQTGCVACDPGYYEDCNTPCPPGWYGRLCETPCQCQAQQECHHVTGCVGGKDGVDDSIVITQTSASSGGNCTSKSKSGCCINYRRDNKTNTCIACPNGWYNEECRDPCPYPYYGHICGSKCDCSNETCNYVTGCNNSNSSNTTIDRESDSNLDHQTKWIIVVSVSVSVVVIVVIIGVFCRCKSGIEYQPKHIQNSTRRQQENDHSVRRPCDSEQPLCHQEPECGTPSDFYDDNSENPYAQITDTARLMPRTKHTPKEVSIPKAPLCQSMSSSQCEETVPYDVLSLKIGSVSDLSSCDWSSPTAHWTKTCAPPPVVKNKTLPPLKRKSFLFPDDPSEYLEEKYVTGPSRSSEAEIKSLPTAPLPPTKIHQNGVIGSTKPARKLPTPPKRTVTLVKKPDKVARNPPRPPKKPPKDSSLYVGSSDNGDPTLIPNGSASVQNESTAEKKSKTAHFMPNTVLRREKSLKATLQKDAMNKRKTNGKSYNLSGLLEVEDMPLPDFEEEEGCSGSQDHLQNGAPPSTVFRKCQTVLKNKMNRISALKFAGNPLRYSFARPQNS